MLRLPNIMAVSLCALESPLFKTTASGLVWAGGVAKTSSPAGMELPWCSYSLNIPLSVRLGPSLHRCLGFVSAIWTYEHCWRHILNWMKTWVFSVLLTSCVVVLNRLICLSLCLGHGAVLPSSLYLFSSMHKERNKHSWMTISL